jgi:hypothetical protein
MIVAHTYLRRLFQLDPAGLSEPIRRERYAASSASIPNLAPGL